MAASAFAIGDKLHIITRRQFERDLRRHFAGEITGVSGELCEVWGYAFVLSQTTNEFMKRPELRTRIFNLGQAGFIVLEMPNEVDLDALRYCYVDKRLVVTDGHLYSLDINEFATSS